MVLNHLYLSKEQLKGFDHYKFYPRCLAPNVLTLGGWILVMGCFLLESFMDYDLTRGSKGSTNPLPDWFWLCSALCTFCAHVMDGTDGKQARRIGASGPTGELFDHGLDSWSTVPFTITIFSVFGRGEFSILPVRLLIVLISVQLVFVVTHWEKYNTGILFLSWGYDASQYGLCFVYLWTWYVGFEWYQFEVIPGWSFATCFEMGFYLSCLGSIGMSFYNMWYSFAVDKTAKQSNIFEAVRPMIPVCLLFTVSIYWAVYSPTQVCDVDPRMFFFAMGTVFSNIACRLIISQMSSTRCSVWNTTLFIYCIAFALSFYVPQHELFILRAVSAVIVASHMHYGICVVRQLCDHFKINALNVDYLSKKQ